jgi:hypothetical protein
LDNGAKFFRIDSDYSGSDEAGVVCGYKGNNEQNYDNLTGEFAKVHNEDKGTYGSATIIKCEPAFLGNIGYERMKYKLKIELSVLFDVRYNPFESASDDNEQKNWDKLNDWANFGYIPVMLYLKDASGRVLYHYENKYVMLSDGYNQKLGGWVVGDGEWGCMYLSYYDFDNRKSSTGFGGWKTNKQTIGYYRGELPKKWKTIGDGEFIDLPPVGGWLELDIGKGVHQFDYKRQEKDVWSIARWLMYKSPTVTIVNSNGTSVEQDDVEDTAWVNKSAKEEYSIDTIVGTLGKTFNASARGLVMGANYEAMRTFCRGGVVDRLERLLIGTVYSQYAERKTTLSGTVRILPRMSVLTDASTTGKFLLLSEVQDLMQDTSEIEMAEFVADNYEGIEYE